jgi:sec-independent protein translocase protein TatB
MIEGQEILVILLVALVVLGPQRLPELARRLGGWTTDLRRAARELRRGLEAEVGDLDDLKGIKKDLQAPLEELKQPFKEVDATMREAQREVIDSSKQVSWIGPVSEQGPSPEEAAEDLAEIESKGEPLVDAPDEEIG